MNRMPNHTPTRKNAVRTLAAASRRPLRWLLAATLIAAIAGCGVIPKKEDITIYTALSRVEPDASWPASRAKLGIARPTSNALLDTARIVVRPQPGEMQVYRGAVWSDPVPEMVQSAVLRILEDSGRIPGVIRRGGGITGDYELVMDIRRFDSDYGAGAGSPNAVVEIAAKMISTKNDAVVGYRLVNATVPAQGTALPEVTAAFQQALGQASREIGGWSLGVMAGR